MKCNRVQALMMLYLLEAIDPYDFADNGPVTDKHVLEVMGDCTPLLDYLNDLVSDW